MSVNFYTFVQYWEPIVGLAGSALGVIFWFLGLRSDITEIKDNHLHTIEQNTGQMKDDLRAFLAYLKAKAEDGKI